MLKWKYRKEFADLVDRSMIILVLKCDKCEAIVARILYPLAAKLDRSCSQHDHSKETGHRDYTALKHLIVYMCAADKKLADQLSKIQRKKFEEFLGLFKANQDKEKDDKPSEQEIIRVTRAILEIIREGRFGREYGLSDLKSDMEYLNSLARKTQPS